MTDSLLWLAIIGVAIAAAPLIYVWRSRDAQKVQEARMDHCIPDARSDHGRQLHAPDGFRARMPGLAGLLWQIESMVRGDQISQAQAALPTGPVTVSKAWIEMAHRYFALAVGVLIIVLTVQAWRRADQAASAAVHRGGDRSAGLGHACRVYLVR